MSDPARSRDPAGTAPPPTLSVVIPTRDRRDKLLETLRALAREHEAIGRPEDFEVVVVDDGSRLPLTEQDFAPLDLPFPLHCLRQAPRGPAAARNRGVRAARGDRLLLLGDDTRPAPGALAHHWSDPRGHNEVGVQGRIDWDPHHEVTPLMMFLAPAGPQFYFVGLHHGEAMSWRSVLGSNLSVPKRWLLDEPYDEAFGAAALEDTEAAVRWARHGWRIEWSEEAIAWHHHRYDDFESFRARQRRAGSAVRLAVSRHPRLVLPLVIEPALGLLLALVRFPFRVLGLATIRRYRRSGSSPSNQPSARPLAHPLERPSRRARWDLASRIAYFRGILTPSPSASPADPLSETS